MVADPKATRKVKPYPIPAQLKDERGSFSAQIVKLTVQGLMLEVSGSSVQPGEKVEVNFVTPVLNGVVVLVGLVIKVYNQLTPSSGIPPATISNAPGSITSIRLVEVHFRSVPNSSMTNIAHFLEKTGQGKRE